MKKKPNPAQPEYVFMTISCEQQPAGTVTLTNTTITKDTHTYHEDKGDRWARRKLKEISPAVKHTHRMT